MPNYARSTIKTHIDEMISGTVSDAKFIIMADKSVREVLADIDMRSMKRKSALSPNLFDDIFPYSAPSDLKQDKIIDIKPQIDRGRFDDWTLVPAEEFDRLKNDRRIDRWGDPLELSKTEQWLGDNLVAVDTRDFVRKVLISKPIDDTETNISTLDAVGDWEGFGDGENLTKDSSNYVKGNASINWDINADGGTTAGIVNSSLDTFDVSSYLTEGSIFVWAYLSSATDVTNFIIRVGSSSSAYYSITITTNNEGNSFEGGWNLLRFDFVNASETGTVDDDACDYVAIYMTKDAGKTSETDYRFDNIIMKVGDHYDLIYYSKYGWQTSAGTYAENSANDTDLINVDTDEIDLIELKMAENIERYILRHKDVADNLKREYEEKKAKYIENNPSEARLLTEEYHTL